MGFLLVLIPSCSNDVEQVKLVSTDSNLPLETGSDVMINYTDSGRTKAIIKAPLLERFSGNEKFYTEMKKGITVKFLKIDGSVESFLTSKYAIRYDRDRKMMARNDVVVLNVKGDTLRTEELYWDELAQRVYSDKFVVITTQTEIIKGYGFESDVSFTSPKIYKISGIVNLK
ncbi:MAG: LPS export ABC transporter periplasmic protein LptC [Bacteroidia bacterium]|jgi:LPS export ABC transporter protein LptC|nr:LPS export ABC transporter periplasmic protein LptC [Bacteroidia bacterium]